MKTEFEVLGLSHLTGTGDDGKPYDYYKAHIAFPSKWVDGKAVAVVSIQSLEVHTRCIVPGSRLEGILMNNKGKYFLYLL